MVSYARPAKLFTANAKLIVAEGRETNQRNSEADRGSRQ